MKASTAKASNVQRDCACRMGVASVTPYAETPWLLRRRGGFSVACSPRRRRAPVCGFRT
ncbi:MAG: hypothetical protein ACLT98_13910 [Eggerthellaceae bacterium]